MQFKHGKLKCYSSKNKPVLRDIAENSYMAYIWKKRYYRDKLYTYQTVEIELELFNKICKDASEKLDAVSKANDNLEIISEIRNLLLKEE